MNANVYSRDECQQHPRESAEYAVDTIWFFWLRRVFHEASAKSKFVSSLYRPDALTLSTCQACTRLYSVVREEQTLGQRDKRGIFRKSEAISFNVIFDAPNSLASSLSPHGDFPCPDAAQDNRLAAAVEDSKSMGNMRPNVESADDSALSGQVAQLVEQWTENPCVAGSIPALPIWFISAFFRRFRSIDYFCVCWTTHGVKVQSSSRNSLEIPAKICEF
jgi:hypothetical protein